MKKLNGYSLVILASGFCMGLFQNCSKISAQDLANGAVNNQSQSMATAEPQVAQTGNLVDRGTSVLLTPHETQAVISEPKADETTAIISTPTTSIAAVSVIAAVTKNETVESQHESTAVLTSEAIHEEHQQTLAIAKNDGEEKVEASEETLAIAECLHKHKKELSQSDTYSHLKGAFEIAVDQINEISDSHGKLIVFASKTIGHINKISNFHGKIILCNMDIDVADQIHGKMILVNSKIISLTNQHGSIHSFNSIIVNADQLFKSAKNH